MKERPILFSAAMVNAILAGKKTQTRRVVKPQPPHSCSYVINGAQSHALCHKTGDLTWWAGDLTWWAGDLTWWVPPTAKSTDHRLACPFGQPGDRLWVKETHSLQGADEKPGGGRVRYRADGGIRLKDGQFSTAIATFSGKWRPSIFMPRWASRITLEVTGVRVERLQAITEADAIAEGIEENTKAPAAWRPRYLIPGFKGTDVPKAATAYAELWESINGHGTWEGNPWVWVIEFRRVKQ